MTASKRKWCECKHPDAWHDESGQCHAFVGLEFEYDCECATFKEAVPAVESRRNDPDPQGRIRILGEHSGA
jgi:hypothetical protein